MRETSETGGSNDWAAFSGRGAGTTKKTGWDDDRKSSLIPFVFAPAIARMVSQFPWAGTIVSTKL
jgi:hypothetical protein